jgi:hypothetical protein
LPDVCPSTEWPVSTLRNTTPLPSERPPLVSGSSNPSALTGLKRARGACGPLMMRAASSLAARSSGVDASLPPVASFFWTSIVSLVSSSVTVAASRSKASRLVREVALARV